MDNPLFYPVQLLLNLIREPGAQATLPAFLVYAWFDRLPLLFGYYAYYDSYIDLVTGKQYPCAINILADRTVYVLSELQVYVASFYDIFSIKWHFNFNYGFLFSCSDSFMIRLHY